MKPTIEITALYLQAFHFPAFSELKTKGWKVPGGDEELVKDSLIKTLEGHLLMIIRRGKDVSISLRPLEIDDQARGMDKLTALSLLASIYEEFED